MFCERRLMCEQMAKPSCAAYYYLSQVDGVRIGAQVEARVFVGDQLLDRRYLREVIGNDDAE